MNRKTWSLSIAAAALCLFSASAHAAEPGFYVTASLGIGDEDPKSAGTNVGNSQGIFHVDPDQVDVDDGKTAFSIGLGYRINKYLAGEVEYVDFGTTDISEHYTIPNTPGAPFPFPTELTVEYSSNVTGPVLSLLGTLPVGENFELFVRGGVLFGSRGSKRDFAGLDARFASTVWLGGAGATWSFAKNWAIRAEYQHSGKFSESLIFGETSVQRLSLSALFRL
jgi:opacity protein-like surface antigen